MIIKQKEHGTANSYNLGCRCPLCKRAKRDYRKDNPMRKHGTKWGYDKGCRCDDCKKAKTAYWRKKHPDIKPPTTDIKNQTRKCIYCKEVKPLECFSKNIREFLGKAYDCKLCHNKRGRDNKNKPRQRYATYKSGAKTRKIDFDLSYEEFIFFWNKNCYYCGNEIDGIGLDRKISSEGYNVKNVVPCCSQCNRSKTIQTADQFITMCIKIAKRFKNHNVSALNRAI